jgi:hypothetical protein
MRKELYMLYIIINKTTRQQKPVYPSCDSLHNTAASCHCPLECLSLPFCVLLLLYIWHLSPFRTNIFTAGELPSTAATVSVLKSHPPGRKFVFVSVWTHYPTMLHWQYSAIAHFCQEDFIFLFVDGSSSTSRAPQTSQQLDKVVSQLEYGHFFQPSVPNNETFKHIINESVSYNHAYNVQSATNFLLHKEMLQATDVLFLINSDMFPLDFFSFADFSSPSGFTSNIRLNHGIEFLWPNLCIIDLLVLGQTPGLEAWQLGLIEAQRQRQTERVKQRVKQQEQQEPQQQQEGDERDEMDVSHSISLSLSYTS